MPCRNSFVGFITLAVAIVLLGLSGCAHVPPPLPPVIVEPPPPAPPQAPPTATAEIDSPRFARISQVAKREIAAGNVPGAVILVGHQGRIVYRKAFGLRAVEPFLQLRFNLVRLLHGQKRC